MSKSDDRPDELERKDSEAELERLTAELGERAMLWVKTSHSGVADFPSTCTGSITSAATRRFWTAAQLDELLPPGNTVVCRESFMRAARLTIDLAVHGEEKAALDMMRPSTRWTASSLPQEPEVVCGGLPRKVKIGREHHIAPVHAAVEALRRQESDGANVPRREA